MAAEDGQTRSGVDGGGLSVAHFQVFLVHLIEDDRVPGCFTPALRDVVFPSPAPHAQLFDEVQIPQYTAHHDHSPNNNLDRNRLDSGGYAKGYIRRAPLGKKLFVHPTRISLDKIYRVE